jgi:hypothetical protein
MGTEANVCMSKAEDKEQVGLRMTLLKLHALREFQLV